MRGLFSKGKTSPPQPIGSFLFEISIRNLIIHQEFEKIFTKTTLS